MTSLSGFKPMRAQDYDQYLLRDLAQRGVPFAVEEKYEGVRLLITPNGVKYRTGKALANAHLNKTIMMDMLPIISDLLPEDFVLEGEFVVGYQAEDSQEQSTSFVNTINRELPNAADLADGIDYPLLFLFNYEPSRDYIANRRMLVEISNRLEEEDLGFYTAPSNTLLLDQGDISSGYVDEFFNHVVASGGEGIVYKRIDRYGCLGRSTKGHLMRRVPWKVSDGVIVNILPKMHNPLAADGNIYNQGRKPTDKNLLVPTDLMGVMQVKLESGEEVNVGTFQGIQDEQRREILANKQSYLGRTVAIRHGTSGKGKAVKLSFQSFRPDKD